MKYETYNEILALAGVSMLIMAVIVGFLLVREVCKQRTEKGK
jgi:hypothetical protein